MYGRQRAVGALVVAFDEPTGPDVSETETLAAFAEHVAAFLDVAEQQRLERHARARAATMGRFTRLAATRLEPKALLEAAAAEILPLSGAEQVIFYSAHARNAVLIPMAHKGRQGDEPARLTQRIDLTAEPLAPLIEDRTPLIFQAAEKPIPDELAVFADARSVLLLPLIVRDVLTGAAAVAAVSREQDFDTALVEFLHDVVQPIALGMENARLFTSLAQTAGTDELSQLANRRKFMETLATEESRARRNRTALGLLIVDVDHLKKVNDTYGHPAGDRVIRHVADTLTRRRRITDLPARMGGEEFALLLPGTGKEPATMTAERICREISDKPVPDVGKVTVSIGVAGLDEVEDGEGLIKLADQRLYAAKAGGRNQVCNATPDEMVSLVPED
jgi:diguanylate cyclase (GGDEF)-like protein